MTASRRSRQLLGPDHILTLAGAPHAPQRTHPIETTEALLRALALTGRSARIAMARRYASR